MKEVPLQPAIQCTVAVGPGVPGHGVAGQCRRSCGRCTKSWPPRHQLWDSWCLGPEELCQSSLRRAVQKGEAKDLASKAVEVHFRVAPRNHSY